MRLLNISDLKVLQSTYKVMGVERLSSTTRLSITVGRKPIILEFESGADRERLAASIEQLRAFGGVEDSSSLRIRRRLGDSTDSTISMKVWISTWNMGNSKYDSLEWIPKGEYDIYSISLQESPDIETDLIEYFGKEAELIASHSLWGIRLLLFCKPELRSEIRNIESQTVMTGAEGLAGNKGGVAVSFSIDDTPLLFIGCHLAAHLPKISQRNEHFWSIIKHLKLGSRCHDALSQFHYVFWMGDLNYRLDLKRENAWNKVVSIINSEELSLLYECDQLHREMSNNQVFIQFEEDLPTFNPTYKFISGSLDYNTKRIPSWCDRILVRKYPLKVCKRLEYKSEKSELSSDHLPVIGLFEIETVLPPPPARVFSSVISIYCAILIDSISLSGKREKRKLIFHSQVLGKQFETEETQGKWRSSDIPPMEPIISDLSYLKRSYILATILNKSNKYFGWAVIPIGSLIDESITVNVEKYAIKICDLRIKGNILITNDPLEYEQKMQNWNN